MPALLFTLRGVPEEEADEVRALLDRHGVDYYETPPGNWGISAPGLWVSDEAALARGRALIEHYQAQRVERSRADYERREQNGEVETLLARARRHPLQTLLVLAALAAVLYLSTAPFFGLATSVGRAWMPRRQHLFNGGWNARRSRQAKTLLKATARVRAALKHSKPAAVS